MSVRNILDSIGGSPTVDFHFDHSENVTFAGPTTVTSNVIFRRTKSLCVIAIEPIDLGTIATSSPLYSTGFTLPPEMKPTGPGAITSIYTTNVYISNGASYLGIGYVTKGGSIGISGGPNFDDPFTVGSTNAGLPYGCLLVYNIE